jgi:hypothetical protein
MNDRISDIRARYEAIEITTPKKAAKDLMQAKSDLGELLAELDRLTEAGRWIPTAEKMPEEPYGCLLMVEEDDHYGEPQKVLLPYFAGYDGAGWNDGEGKRIPFEVTHWMPLPAAPKGASND